MNKTQFSQTVGPQIQWVESFVTPDKIYCVYIATNEKRNPHNTNLNTWSFDVFNQSTEKSFIFTDFGSVMSAKK